MPNPIKPVLRLIKGGKTAKEGEKALEAFRVEQTVGEAAVKAQSALIDQAPVRVAHPFNEKEIFQFPPGTSEQNAKRMVLDIIKKRAREGTEKIDLPSSLPKERVQELEAKEKELEKLQGVVKDLESRKDIRKMAPGLYSDDTTGKYWRVTPDAHIEEVSSTLDVPAATAQSMLFETKIMELERSIDPEGSAKLDFWRSAHEKGLLYDEAVKEFKKIFKD